MKPEEGRGIPEDDNISTLLPPCHNYYDVLKKGLGTTPDLHTSTYQCYAYGFRVSQGDFLTTGGKPLPPSYLV